MSGMYAPVDELAKVFMRSGEQAALDYPTGEKSTAGKTQRVNVFSELVALGRMPKNSEYRVIAAKYHVNNMYVDVSAKALRRAGWQPANETQIKFKMSEYIKSGAVGAD